MKNGFLTIGFVSSLLFLFPSCSNDAPTQEPPRQDTVKKDTVVQVINKELKPAHAYYNDVARYIAGLPAIAEGGLDSSLRRNAEWKKFSEAFEKNWHKYDSTRLQVMKAWRDTELQAMNSSSKTLFYPFAGADFLNAYTFFPNADTFILIGLEPVGTIPDFRIDEDAASKVVVKKSKSKESKVGGEQVNNTQQDSIRRYFHKVNSSLHAILNFSFFRTKSMSADFKDDELNGTIHLMLLFISRTGNTITDIKPVGISKDGGLVYIDSSAAGVRRRGMEIEFTAPDSTLKRAYYFSVNLADDMLKKDTSFVAFVDKLAPYNTYLKSASYLMYNSYFSEIRDHLILGNSKYVLEDDSGMPLRFFDPNVWDVQLYGSYERPIPMFSMHRQQDLADAYKDSTKVKVLPFGIGYNYRPGKSNLLLAKKKSAVGS
jgi:hypothetical protein